MTTSLCCAAVLFSALTTEGKLKSLRGPCDLISLDPIVPAFALNGTPNEAPNWPPTRQNRNQLQGLFDRNAQGNRQNCSAAPPQTAAFRSGLGKRCTEAKPKDVVTDDSIGFGAALASAEFAIEFAGDLITENGAARDQGRR